MMELIGIGKRYGKRDIIKDVSMTIAPGQCVGILGANGSGKSTLLSILAGVQKADCGQCLLDGTDLFKQAKLRAKQIGYVPQGNPLLEELTGYDNLLLWYERKALKEALGQGVLFMLGIHEFVHMPVHKMSGGMKKRLSIGCAVANQPQILLLDEPTAALDLICKERIYQYLQEVKAKGGRILLTTHDVQELSLCDCWYILKDGALMPYQYDGNVQNLVQAL